MSLQGKLNGEQMKELETHLNRSVKSGIFISPLDQSIYFEDELDGETVELMTWEDVDRIVNLSEDIPDFHKRMSHACEKQYERKFAKPSSSRFDEYGRYVGDIHV